MLILLTSKFWYVCVSARARLLSIVIVIECPIQLHDRDFIASSVLQLLSLCRENRCTSLFVLCDREKENLQCTLLIRLLIASNGICWIWIRVWFTLADLIGVKMKTQQKSNWKFPFPFQHPARESRNTKQCGRQLQTHKHWKQHKSFAFQIREYVWSATSIHYKYITFANALEWNKCRLFIIRLRWQLNSNQCATL